MKCFQDHDTLSGLCFGCDVMTMKWAIRCSGLCVGLAFVTKPIHTLVMSPSLTKFGYCSSLIQWVMVNIFNDGSLIVTRANRHISLNINKRILEILDRLTLHVVRQCALYQGRGLQIDSNLGEQFIYVKWQLTSLSKNLYKFLAEICIIQKKLLC